MAEGATVSHAPSSALSGLAPAAGGLVEPLRPACPTCRPSFEIPYWRAKSTTRLSAFSFSSVHSVAHLWEMRPTMLTLVISAITTPHPPIAKLPMCIRCQSFAVPSVELYWHIGDTAVRFAKVNPRKVIGENKALAIGQSFVGKFGWRGS